jgi:hypothetical protein
MPISFARLQEYLDRVVAKSGGDIGSSPHKRFWTSYEALTQQPLPKPKCNGEDIFVVKYVDAAKTIVDPDGSPLYLILTQPSGFCDRDQMPPGGPFIVDQGYSIALSDGTVVSGTQVAKDIHEWLSAGAKNN